MNVPNILSSEPLRITPLGAGNEVGRSCIILSYKNKNIMLDCGIHPAYSGLNALPFFDEIDPASIDLVLITHFHLDHAASLPYFTEKTSFKGKIYMTHPTKAIYKWILTDYVRVSNVTTSISSADDQLYNENDLINSFEKIIAIDFHQRIDLDGIIFTAFNAGHVLGAAMFLIEIAGTRILYTGDYSREEDRHLMVAERPPKDLHIDVMICESTYGVQSHMPRLEREKRFTSLVHEIVGRGGRCLLPVFALGRAQELLLILDEYWQSHPELQKIPIYFTSALAKRCITIYQTYINSMSEKIQKQFNVSNPFIFKHISSIKSIEQFEDVGPCVMLASPGMLQNGLSRELLEQWCPNKKNGVIIAGYCVEGTLAKQILSEPSEITAISGAKIPLRMSVEYISFSAHVDFIQNSGFIEDISPSNLVFVHGEQNEMSRLKSALLHKQEQQKSFQDMKMFCPRNCESVQLEFRGEKIAKVIGENFAQSKDSIVNGILVGKDFEYEIVAIDQLKEFTNISITSLKQKQSFICSAPLSLLEFHLNNLFGSKNVERVGPNSVIIMKRVLIEDVKHLNTYTLEWEGNPLNDMIADTISAISLHAEISRSSVRLSKSNCHHHHDSSNNENRNTPVSVDEDVVLRYLDEHFENVTVDEDEGSFIVKFFDDDTVAKINSQTMEVDCCNVEKKLLIEKKLEKLIDVFQII